MLEKFSIDEFMIRVMPGGVFLAVLYFLYGKYFSLAITESNDLLYTFIFFCVSFIIGELLQTLAHESEWIIDIFFKFRRPSEIFLYKNNPVLKSDHQRNNVIKHLKLSEDEKQIFNTDYKKLSFLKVWKIDRGNNAISQSIFWTLYSQVSDLDEIKTSNRGYLFVRVTMLLFLLITILLFINYNINLGLISLGVFIIFLWRSRGYARGLVFKIVLLNLKKK